MPYPPPAVLSDSPPPGTSSDIDDPSGLSLTHPELDPYAPYSSSDEPSEEERPTPEEEYGEGEVDPDALEEHLAVLRSYDAASTHIPLLARADSLSSAGTLPAPLTLPYTHEQGPTSAPAERPVLPRMTRAFSMPLPEQLRHLRHPLPGAGSMTWDPTSPTTTANGGLFSPTSDSPTAFSSNASFPPSPLPVPDYLHLLSLELADTIQPIIQTLLQLTPPHILDPAKEQFSACTVGIPTASVSGLLMAMKGLNYLSGRLAREGIPAPASVLGYDTASSSSTGTSSTSITTSNSTTTNSRASPRDTPPEQDETFDIGELLQSIGDTLAGLAADKCVDLVLYHAEVGMLHVGVRGDESEVGYLLGYVSFLFFVFPPPRHSTPVPGLRSSLVLRQILAVAQKGDTIELGLTLSHAPPFPSRSPPSAPTADYQCTFDILHRFPPSSSRVPPVLNSRLATHLLHSLHATLSSPSSSHYLLTIPLPAGPSPSPPPLTPQQELSRQPFPSYRLPPEPTLAELASFVRLDLRGKRVALYASPRSVFGRHVTSYLTSWGMDVVHVPTDELEGLISGEGEEEEEGSRLPGEEEPSSERSRPGSGLPSAHPDQPDGLPDPVEHSAGTGGGMEADGEPRPAKLSFVIIDDDVPVLRRRLVQMRKERERERGREGWEFRLRPAPVSALPAIPTGAMARRAAEKLQLSQGQGQSPQRPLSHRRAHPRSPGSGDPPTPPTSAGPADPSPSGLVPQENPVIIHFTSLSNFKLVRDAVQTLLALPQPGSQPLSTLPEIIVIPKPAGPRRLLTALHTGMYKPLVDPFFAPIATSPLSPASVPPFSPFFTPPTGNDQDPLSLFPQSQSQSQSQSLQSPVITAPSHSPSPNPGPLNLHPLQHTPHGTLFLPGGLQKSRSPGPSPLAQPPATVPEGEYFPGDAVKIGSSANSGVLLQSPDGRPAGVIFQPLGRAASSSTAAGGLTPPDGAVPTGPDLDGAVAPGTKPLMISKSSGESVPRQVPIGMIFSPSQVIDSYRSPGVDGPPHLPAGPSRRQIKRVTTAETRPFLLPGMDEESGDNTTPAAVNRFRSGARRTSSASTTGGSAASIPLPPSRPGSSRIPSGGSAHPSATPSVAHRVAGRRASGQIVNVGAMNFVLGDGPAPAPLGPVLPNVVDPEKQAQRENIRKLIQAGAEAVAPAVTSASEHVLPTTSVLSAAPAVTIASLPNTASGHNTPSPLPISPPSDHASPVKSPPVVAALRRTSDTAVSSPGGKKKSVGDNVIVPPINVLIVEDNPINQTILMTFMRRKKIKYGTANDGAQAVEKWKTGGYHLILMDIQMPVMDGIQATKEIRRLESQSNFGLYPTTPPVDSLRAGSPAPIVKPPATPGSMPQSSPHRSSVIIVALTASSLQSDRVAALAAGCNDFLTKPVSLKWLEKKIIEWGSIKALQMWADSAVTHGFSSGQAARGAKVRDQLRINRSGRNSPSGHSKGKGSGTDTDTPSSHPSHRPVSGPAPVLGKGTKETVSADPVPTVSTCPETIDDRRAQSSISLSSYFPDRPPDVFAPNDTKSLLLQDVLDDEDDDSPAETIKEISPRRKSSMSLSPGLEAH
ncbi:hypothetical protein DACRYDRAFT_112857 [Dacryopinax primogenitus]|uniref:Response regulatory domain-containing protein n=1 Tax=Dacryopinax primogenitus (strain DJM 731) TaxID=1858805 RepID=M5GF97_DACPD|nr:uncharacterized protein DACRYDRAFT_112857 [Dacryopinax primogenitus]EJU06077.1 hypothetical protein DACRYDRAFT_112857 [Dacryopinax primogenitus]